MQKKRIYFLLICAFLLVTGISSQRKQVGKATYYGKRAHGRITSSGEMYHRDSMTCAHRTYPFGTILKVHDLGSDREVYVKVTDRGPFVRGRVIDLSYAAARELNILGRGISKVEITQAGNDVRIPYEADGIEFPQLEVRTPDGSGYCHLAEWAEKSHRKDSRKMLAHADNKQVRHVGVSKAKKDSIPRWKIFDKLCAQGGPGDTLDKGLQ